MFFRRKLLARLERELETEEMVVITGMRQVGKTTILKYLFDKVMSKNKATLDLGNPLNRKVFEEENYDNIWRNLRQFGVENDKKAYLFLDEVQNLPEISRVAKYLFDHYRVKLFLTGSSSFYLKNLFPESMAGRKLIFELFPLTFEEFLIFKGVERKVSSGFGDKAKNKNRVAYGLYVKYYDEFLEFGGFPKVVLESNLDRKKGLLGEVFKSYFEQDVKSLADFENLSKVRDLILLLTSRVGSKVGITKLASELGVARETVYGYLAFLEQTYFISLLPKFSKSVDRQAAGEKKLYFCDVGLSNFLGRLSWGQILENGVFQCLRTDTGLTYYEKWGSFEVDFITNSKVGLEVKKSPSRRDLSNLKKRSKLLGLAEFYAVSYDFSQDKEVILGMDL